MRGPFLGKRPLRVDYAALYHARFPLLKKAFERGWDRDAQDVAAFEAQNGDWLPDYALYRQSKCHFDMVSWTQWPDEALRLRQARSPGEVHPDAGKPYPVLDLSSIPF